MSEIKIVNEQVWPRRTLKITTSKYNDGITLGIGDWQEWAEVDFSEDEIKQLIKELKKAI